MTGRMISKIELRSYAESRGLRADYKDEKIVFFSIARPEFGLGEP